MRPGPERPLILFVLILASIAATAMVGDLFPPAYSSYRSPSRFRAAGKAEPSLERVNHEIAEVEAAIHAAREWADPRELAEIAIRLDRAKDRRDGGELAETLVLVKQAMRELILLDG